MPAMRPRSCPTSGLRAASTPPESRHSLPGSKMGKMVEDYKKLGVKFKEVTVAWYSEHPEIDASKSELIKILTTKE